MAEEFEETSPFMRSHRNTWHGFTRLMMWSVGGAIIVLIFLALITL